MLFGAAFTKLVRARTDCNGVFERIFGDRCTESTVWTMGTGRGEQREMEFIEDLGQSVGAPFDITEPSKHCDIWSALKLKEGLQCE